MTNNYLKRDRKKKTLLVTEDLQENSTDFITIFIGVTIVALGIMNLVYNVPIEFGLGATFAGFFFAYSDFWLLKDRFGMIGFYINLILLLLGVFSYFMLPIILIMYPSLAEKFASSSNGITLAALGLVVIVMGVRSFDIKNKKIKLLRSEIELLNKEIKELKSQ